MGNHSEIHSALCARLASLVPSAPVAWEGTKFAPPDPRAPNTPQVTSVTWPDAALAGGEVFSVSVDGSDYSVTATAGSTVADNVARLAAIVFPSAAAAGGTLTITGLDDATPMSVSCGQAGGLVVKEQQPVLGNMWLRPILMPAATVQASLGDDGLNVHRGIFKVSVFGPHGHGWMRVKALADAICRHFARGTHLHADDVLVLVGNVYPGPVIPQEDGWLHVPVTINYTSHTNND